jgi:hypothetical protein
MVDHIADEPTKLCVHHEPCPLQPRQGIKGDLGGFGIGKGIMEFKGFDKRR